MKFLSFFLFFFSLLGNHAVWAGNNSSNDNDWQTIGRYLVKDSLVKDTVTGLMWMRCSMGQQWNNASCQGKATEYEWSQLTKITTDFSYAGYSDWRVPSKDELKTLVYCSNAQPIVGQDDALSILWSADMQDLDSRCSGDYERPTIFRAVFMQTPATWFWSSSPYTGNTRYAWDVDFSNGFIGYDQRNYSFVVRLVRGGQVSNQ